MQPGKYADLDNVENHPFVETLLLHLMNVGWKAEDSDEFWEELDRRT